MIIADEPDDYDPSYWDYLFPSEVARRDRWANQPVHVTCPVCRKHTGTILYAGCNSEHELDPIDLSEVSDETFAERSVLRPCNNCTVTTFCCFGRTPSRSSHPRKASDG